MAEPTRSQTRSPKLWLACFACFLAAFCGTALARLLPPSRSLILVALMLLLAGILGALALAVRARTAQAGARANPDTSRETLSEAASHFAHDAAQPIQAMVMASSLLRKLGNDPAIKPELLRQLTQKITEGSDRLNRLLIEFRERIKGPRT